ncbi:hypothetical protein [Rhizobium sp. 42MFCr.1]|uniref:hypothetical protein n=1 Tax=Rhizobium sp. 42MFCr.1 TaxID=1048680 RepID=UPI00037FE92E|nr:hypothetical protein [Rhizobium sp. 42MFCr.1]
MTFAIVTTLIIVLVASARYLTYALVGYLDYFLEERRKLAARKKGIRRRLDRFRR